ncbi:oligoendopeptidase F [Brevibacillus formosus]|uniref:oligoendopeptidase F n=2 Tax=Brevibacillus TaxID=55080 RepID=UPI002E20FA68|nr:oligoendopeptidase F [Brevibacillus formosus]MED1944308.1 oligoendopeptidase F [Brevibacillus formosus]MED1999320.1 oligoendopeptidase F [Brevibacillus formosus]MED2082543.1 oligoendopeptidase F [Brevibacillus formosus]
MDDLTISSYMNNEGVITVNKSKTLPKRSDVPAEYKWRLEDMYPTDNDWEADVQKVKQLTEKIAAMKGSLVTSGKQLLAVLTLQDELLKTLDQVYVYARMRRDEDNANSKYQGLTDRATSLSTQVYGSISYIQPEILAIPTEDLQTWIKEVEGLEHYRILLEEITRFKPHTLSAEEEALLANMSELASSPSKIFGMLNNADMKFPMITDENGEEVELTKGRYTQFMESKDRRVRKEAFEALYSTYGKFRNTIAASLTSAIKGDVFYARTRKYPSALYAALFADNVELPVYDNLIATIHEHLPLMHRYIALRKKLLGVDELHMYDLYVPIVPETDMKIPYDQAVSTIKEALHPLGEEYGRILDEGFSNGWIDVHENEGKTSGAYSWGAYTSHPFVLMNYQDNINNMFTLAHEMGHALHSYYSNHAQPYTYADYKIFVAEVASTLNEALLMNHLLETTTDKKQRMYLINHYLEQFRGTVFRQTMFAEFEKIVHAKEEQGEPLTAESLSTIYRELNVAYHGPDMVVDSEVDLEWARIPHFYRGFYVYKYATGFSAATSLSKQILEEGQPAVDRYLQFLKGGSSDYPLNLLKGAGVDMTSPTPIAEALSVFKELLEELEQLVEQ